MKASDLNVMTLHELNKELVELLHKQFVLRMQMSTQQITNTKLLKATRKDIARIKTVITIKKMHHDK
ncbi:MAG: 50S ribosomal protein L29 [Nitrosomonas sp.]|nr:MAG: 50S ribosomal protein L29 [Nitrosomonas sp.]